jgi:hypothetical protein
MATSAGRQPLVVGGDPAQRRDADSCEGGDTRGEAWWRATQLTDIGTLT